MALGDRANQWDGLTGMMGFPTLGDWERTMVISCEPDLGPMGGNLGHLEKCQRGHTVGVKQLQYRGDR